MGKILRVVSYVAGLKANGSDIQTDYVLKKRAYLRSRADALAQFGNALISRQIWRSSYSAEACTAEEVIETNLDSRPQLRELVKRKDDGEELSLVVVEARDLCRLDKNTAEVEQEWQVFEDISYRYLSVIFSGDFSHADRWSPLERATTSNEEQEIYKSGSKIMEKLLERDFLNKNDLDHDELQKELLGHVGGANHILQRMVKKIVDGRRVKPKK